MGIDLVHLTTQDLLSVIDSSYIQSHKIPVSKNGFTFEQKRNFTAIPQNLTQSESSITASLKSYQLSQISGKPTATFIINEPYKRVF